MIVGVDVGGTKIEAVLAGPGGTVLARRRVPARSGADALIDDVTALVKTVADDRLDLVTAVGIGTPGQVNMASGDVRNIVNLDIDHVPLASGVSAGLGGVPVHVENDVNAAALGAAHLLHVDDTAGNEAGGMPPNIVFLNFGTGLAAGVINDGRIYHGYSCSAGEIGHVPIDPNRFDCPCGQRGCLETVCSGSAVARLWPVGVDTAGDGGTGEGDRADGAPTAPMPALIAAARDGDACALRVLGIVTHAIGDALQLVVQTMDPQRIVIGGGMAKTGEPLLDVIREELALRESDCPFLRGLNIANRLVLAPADAPVGALGAALAA
ncbi:ROK family protein [Bifidobacterium choloepi]|uniref:ROK family protein n=1 Tax=Bifidobacterium choloepi TaxID=2614131 RepID=A0A6I5NFE7_9BIFI|nr:ROK family protein [Bifidobacterium choloepi]NEG70064.1 ROK family protein [Bifidobacterium choloepi]